MSDRNAPIEAMLSVCAREPIHIPEAIQPHGAFVVIDVLNNTVAAQAGAIGALLGTDAPDPAAIESLIGESVTELARRTPATGSILAGTFPADTDCLDVVAHRSGQWLVLEFERCTSQLTAAAALGHAQALAARLEAAQSIAEVCQHAAEAIHQLTGYSRIMVYQFLADDSGAVIAEARDQDIPSLLNHRFPESDIPRQARALYARNHVRVIPNSAYDPSPLQWRVELDPRRPLDMSDCHLRSVSPVHLQYLMNMGVAASASISVMVGGKLWGLIACHHHEGRQLDFVEREMGKHVGQLVGAQVAARQRSAAQLESARLAQLRAEMLQILDPAIGSVEETLLRHAADVMRAIPCDGVAITLDGRTEQFGSTPTRAQLRDLLPRLQPPAEADAYACNSLSGEFASATSFARAASGALAILFRTEPRLSITWFRAEQIETIDWAGNPHKEPNPETGALTPRQSFDLWRETVHRQARPWSMAEVDAAARIRAAIVDLIDKQELRTLNRQLRRVLTDKEHLLAHKDLLMREVHHRVQNSLQLVNSMLYLQERDSGNEEVRVQFELARQRLTAVAMVHRRLWRADKIGDVRLDTFLAELIEELASVWDPRWRAGITLEVAPVTLSTDRSVLLGLVVTELMTNAVKYAYAGEPGPILIEGLQERDGSIRLSIADRGQGLAEQEARQSFGSRLVQTLVGQLAGTLERHDNAPGLRVELVIPAGS